MGEQKQELEWSEALMSAEYQKDESKWSEALGTNLIQLVALKLRVEEKNVTMASRFQDDLGADSLDVVELLMALEDKFDVPISEEEAEQLKTVKDAFEFISQKMKKKLSAATAQ